MLIQQWGVWLTKHDHERALKLLTSLGSGKRKVEDDRALLQQLQDANPTAASQFLEHLVLQKRILDPNLHMQLAMVCVDQLLSCLADEPTSKLWRAKVASYSSGRSDASFLSYFASTTPDSEPKRVRLKTVLFLQGSTLYDPQIIRERLANHEKILRLELAIVDGKLGQHRSALSSLVHDLRDASSAEVYCTLGGEVIPAKTAQSLGERFDLQSWASLLVLPAGKTKPSAVPMSRLVTVDPELKKSLIKILLEVYMSGGEVTADRTARFLDAQAMNLDVMDVRPLYSLFLCLVCKGPLSLLRSLGHLAHSTRMASSHSVYLSSTFFSPDIACKARRTNRQGDQRRREPCCRRANMACLARARGDHRGGRG
ncbi:hypothetical protein AcW1_009756 [Taiwanofungus camphoratus]|nr:hypothetical protein AcW1_009756 [Antrodia cinnamomea]